MSHTPEPRQDVEFPQCEGIARAFHDFYEQLAPDFGYETRPDSAVAWDHVPDTNRRLMIAVVWNLIASNVIDAGGRWDAAYTGAYHLSPVGRGDGSHARG